jgi:FkbM family methyltransferase
MNKEHIVHQMLLRAWPFPRGAGRLIDKFFSELKFADHRATVLTTDGFPMTVLPNDLIGRHIYLTGEFDKTTVDILHDFSEAGDVLLDVGANLGYVSACFLRRTVGSKVICVEPQPVLVDLLRTNLNQFSRDRYVIAPVALSDHDDEGFFASNSKNTGEGRLVDRCTPNAIKVPVRSAASFLSSLELSELDLVKIDVEGHEEIIIGAFKAHLQRLQPRAILFEDQHKRSAPDGPIGSLLQEIGYQVFGVAKHLTKVTLASLTKNYDCVFNDYIAISQKRRLPNSALSRYKLGS